MKIQIFDRFLYIVGSIIQKLFQEKKLGHKVRSWDIVSLIKDGNANDEGTSSA